MPKKANVLSRRAAQLKGALMVQLRPMLAKDQKINLTPFVAGITAKNFSEKKPSLLESLTTALKGKIAQDADVGQLATLLDALEAHEEEEGIDDDDAMETDPNAALPIKSKEGIDDDDDAEDPHEKARGFLAGKLSGEDMKTYDELMAPLHAKKEGADNDPKLKPEGADDDDDDDAEEKVTKSAMDEAIKNAVADATKKAEEKQKAMREAERTVQPYIGNITQAMDSAEAIYKLALDHMGVDLKDVPPAAYRAVLKTVPVPGTKKTTANLGLDSSGDAGFAGRYPEAARISNLG